MVVSLLTVTVAALYVNYPGCLRINPFMNDHMQWLKHVDLDVITHY